MTHAPATSELAALLDHLGIDRAVPLQDAPDRTPARTPKRPTPPAIDNAHPAPRGVNAHPGSGHHFSCAMVENGGLHEQLHNDEGARNHG